MNYGLELFKTKQSGVKMCLKIMQKSLRLIALYTHICESYKAEVQWEVQRFKKLKADTTAEHHYLSNNLIK